MTMRNRNEEKEHLHAEKRHVDLQPGAVAWPGMNLERSADGFDTLAHADEAQASAPRAFDVEPNAVVNNGQRE